jgi:hypothetical protein
MRKGVKHLGLKNESYPFDWILSNLEIINYSILNNFSEFLDKNNYYKSNNKISLIEKNIKYLDTMFNHRDPVDNENDYQYIVRCVNRFNNLQNDNNFKLFFHSIYNNSYNKDELVECNNILNEKFKKYKLIVLNYINSEEKKNYTIDYDTIIIINIYIKYNPSIWYDIDKAIFNFYDNNKPIEEIVKKLS